MLRNVTKCLQEPRTRTDTLIRPKQRKKDMRFGTWNVRSLCRAGSLTEAARGVGIHIVIVNVNCTEDMPLRL